MSRSACSSRERRARTEAYLERYPEMATYNGVARGAKLERWSGE
jgi:hypothetical protein